ncbi:hypothetical protein MLD38_035559 [Melastoma candidum]|uniref:Uncharacterized protein n=1 Tax=Melastoma candidum TaxID=119954 RepID=A0ACB9LGY3_9MYRT|nr:hypothetical protein MLD38_035559 [Melastoma candidum]
MSTNNNNSSNNTTKTHRKNLAISVDLCCSLSCLKPKKLLSAVFHPKLCHCPPPPRSKSHHNRSNCSPFLSRSISFSSTGSSHHDIAATATTASASSSFSPLSHPYSDYNLNSPQELLESESDLDSNPVKGFGRIDGGGIAVEKDSRDPYFDFRHSMLQMIISNEIYSREDLRELLSCFLQLNSPRNHGVIVRAFTEICNGVSSVWSLNPSPNAAPYGYAPSWADY